MAISAKHTCQMPFVGTPEQKFLITTEADSKGVSQAKVLRDALNAYFDLEHDVFREGDHRAPQYQASEIALSE